MALNTTSLVTQLVRCLSLERDWLMNWSCPFQSGSHLQQGDAQLSHPLVWRGGVATLCVVMHPVVCLFVLNCAGTTTVHLGWEHHSCYQLTSTSGGLSSQCASRWFLNVFAVPLFSTSWGRTFQVVVMLMGKKCSANDILNRFTNNFFTLFRVLSLKS